MQHLQLDVYVCIIASTTVCISMYCSIYNCMYKYVLQHQQLYVYVCIVASTIVCIFMYCSIYNCMYMYVLQHLQLYVYVCIVASTSVYILVYCSIHTVQLYSVYHVEYLISQHGFLRCSIRTEARVSPLNQGKLVYIRLVTA